MLVAALLVLIGILYAIYTVYIRLSWAYDPLSVRGHIDNCKYIISDEDFLLLVSFEVNTAVSLCRLYFVFQYWNGNDVILTKFSTLAAPEVVNDNF